MKIEQPKKNISELKFAVTPVTWKGYSICLLGARAEDVEQFVRMCTQKKKKDGLWLPT